MPAAPLLCLAFAVLTVTLDTLYGSTLAGKSLVAVSLIITAGLLALSLPGPGTDQNKKD